ncbi:hypothetical protein CSW25_07050 [Thermus scotoductus]|uniref:Uncharacterized protein n=1 Tax=Thermus scotoductus TaxID=37636 RepID=A0A430R0J3_THESC|nr:hypothetical protein [Thermus scotoductus]AYJ74843.1 hypothetical protein phiMa_60 [Thermus phage phiMa]RTG93482.1 hypothetical protein CSW49_10660 [Thermus scotoductus]RTH00847.1 hypothetical protein CSW45_12250 [Thermus scotoductus]RTH06775.1 hypothetical protein CSW46_11710 [Thermus scotoductus]RTH08710.1 hypothetical protein CSW44_10950 [Thermus scotoductus]
MKKRAKQVWARLWGAYATALKTDEAIREAAKRLEAHHQDRLEALAPLIPAPGVRGDDLEEEYLESLFQRYIARIYAGEEA